TADLPFPEDARPAFEPHRTSRRNDVALVHHFHPPVPTTLASRGDREGPMTLNRRMCKIVATIAVFLTAIASFASAQSSATIAGSVRDAQGGVIPGATITLVSE